MAESEEAAELRLNLEKRLVAPQQRAFEAFVDAEQPRRWWGPPGFTASHLVSDAVEGAQYRIAMQPPDGDGRTRSSGSTSGSPSGSTR